MMTTLFLSSVLALSSVGGQAPQAPLTTAAAVVIATKRALQLIDLLRMKCDCGWFCSAVVVIFAAVRAEGQFEASHD